MWSRSGWQARRGIGASLGTLAMLPGVAFAGGTGWQAVGDPDATVSGTVGVLEVIDLGDGPSLYVGGLFSTIGEQEFNNIARWDGQNWHPLTMNGVAGVNGSVQSISAFDDGSGPAIYVFGNLTSASGVSVDRLARWDGMAWTPVSWTTPAPAIAVVEAMQAFDDGSGPALYMTGLFLNVLSGPANVARLRNGVIEMLPSTPGGGIGAALTVIDDGSGSSLYLGTAATSQTPVDDAPLYRWNGAGWDQVVGVEPGVSYLGGIGAMTPYNDGSGKSLFIAGSLEQRVVSAPRVTMYAGKLVGNGIESLVDVENRGLSASASALAVYDRGDKQVLIAAGSFFSSGNITLRSIGMWDGVRWSPLGDPGFEGVTGGSPSSLAVFDGGDGAHVYIGGTFTAAAGQPGTSRIARWSMEPLLPCPADLTGPALNGIPDGLLSAADLNFYIALWLEEDSAADISNPSGDGSPDGIVTIHDLTYYLELWLAGCPSN